MADMESIRPYKKEFTYSYCLGAFPTIELIKARPELVLGVYIHSSYTDREALEAMLFRYQIPILMGDRIISRVSEKENVFVIGVFKKYECTLEKDRSHIVLVNPGNMGNFGTILRTAAALGIYDIGIIRPGVDSFHPKVVRSSMGALFRLRHTYFDSFQEYQNQYSNHELFPFMLQGEKQLTIKSCPKASLFSLIFGNEAAGLPESYCQVGTSVVIPQTSDADSLNLPIAVGIGTFLFMSSQKES